KLFILYLVGCLAVLLVRSIGLARGLWPVFTRLTNRKESSDAEVTDRLAIAALAGGLSQFQSSSEFSTTLLEQAERKFLQLWDWCSLQVESFTRMIGLICLLSILVFSYLLIGVFEGISISKQFGAAAFYGSIAEALTTFTVGIFVATAFS